jgi:hypothetical protein
LETKNPLTNEAVVRIAFDTLSELYKNEANTSSILRRCLTIANLLGAAVDKKWISSELNGYDSSEKLSDLQKQLPDYRLVRLLYKDHYGRLITFPQQLSFFQDDVVTQGIGEVEAAAREGVTIIDGGIIDIVRKEGNKYGIKIASATVDKIYYLRIIERVRTRALEFINNVLKENTDAVNNRQDNTKVNGIYSNLGSIEVQTLDLFDELIAEGKNLHLENYSDEDENLRADYIAWKTSCLFNLGTIFAPDNTYVTKINYVFNLGKTNSGTPSLEKKSALKILENAKIDYIRLSTSKNDKQVKDKPLRIFISYQTKHVQIACKIQDIITKNSNLEKKDVFVAHRDIPISEEWRKIMIEELENSTHVIALCTEEYQSSAFGNQEIGFAIARNMKITPIFWKGTDRSKFGFLEGKQSLPEFADDLNIEGMVRRILSAYGIKVFNPL